MKNFNVNDLRNPSTIILSDSSFLTVIPSLEYGMLRAIDYDFSGCKSMKLRDKNNIISLPEIFEENLNDNFFKFNTNNDIETNQLNKKGITFEISFDPLNDIGQFHIYRE